MSHRPTFVPAVGQSNGGGFRYHAPRQQFSERMQTAHTKLKFRHDVTAPPNATQSSNDDAEFQKQKQIEIRKRREMAKRLELESKLDEQTEAQSAAENDNESTQTSSSAARQSQSFASNNSSNKRSKPNSSSVHDAEDEKQQEQYHEAISASPQASSAHQHNDNASSDLSSDSEDNDEASLVLELARIRAERQQQKIEAQKAAEAAAQQLAEEQERLAQSNPLLRDTFKSQVASNQASDASSLNNSSAGITGVKRRWDSDLIFSGQQSGDVRGARGQQNRFVNDTIRSAPHKQFMKKYIH